MESVNPEVSEPVVAPVVDPATPVVDPVVAPVVDDKDPVEPVVPVEPVKPAEGDFTPVTEDVKFSDGIKFGGQDVEVTIPADLVNFTAEKGIDAQAVSKELYASEDFTLSEETKASLYEAFGQWQVDTYLAGIKASNDNTMASHASDVEALGVAEKAAWDATMEVMGGEDRWDDLSSYADQTMDDAEFDEFNEVMKTGSLRMQQLMIADVFGKFKAAGAPVATTILDLEEGATGGDPTGGDSPLSQSAFLDLMRTGEYKKDPAKYDALRRAGMAKGI